MMALQAGRMPRWRVALLVVYLAGILPLLMFFNVGLTPDVLIFIFIGAALVVGRPLLFVRDWGAFLLILVLWQQTGPVARWAGFPLHMKELIDADRFLAWPFLHGALPQVWLQQRLLHWRQWQWYDVLSWAVYGLHFIEPLLAGFAIWLRTRAVFQRFATAYLVLAGLAFIGYIVYPAIPPWMAADYLHHAIPHVVNLFSAFNDWVLKDQLHHPYRSVLHVSYNLTAAMPSLHAAFPLLSALYLRKTYGNWGLLMLGYAAIVWFAVVYMAEHWIIDVLVGLGCAVLAYALVEGVAWVRIRVRRRLEPPMQAAAAR